MTGNSKTSMPVGNLSPGEKMYIDWVGDQPELLLDTTTGETPESSHFYLHLVLAALFMQRSFRMKNFHILLPAQYMHCLIMGQFLNIVPDNLRTAVTRHSKDELVLQSAFSDLETFYDTIILPPPPRKPKGKPTVENHVRFLETHLVEELKKDTYTSLGSSECCGQKDRSRHQPALFSIKNLTFGNPA